jgi:hypothetical protein
MTIISPTLKIITARFALVLFVLVGTTESGSHYISESVLFVNPSCSGLAALHFAKYSRQSLRPCKSFPAMSMNAAEALKYCQTSPTAVIATVWPTAYAQADIARQWLVSSGANILFETEVANYSYAHAMGERKSKAKWCRLH